MELSERSTPMSPESEGTISLATTPLTSAYTSKDNSFTDSQREKVQHLSAGVNVANVSETDSFGTYAAQPLGREARITASEFVTKLYSMLEDESIQHLMSWSSSGDGFIIHSPSDFSKVLSSYFTHTTNMLSFVQQLNMHGFYKVNDLFSATWWEYRHEDGLFQRGGASESRESQRTKTGCLPCQKLRIGCDKKRPSCTNCIRSERHCAGYSEQPVFEPQNAKFRVATDDNTIPHHTNHRRPTPPGLQKSQRPSGTGCGHCRRRRIRCDEKRPACGLCKRLKKSCIYHSDLFPETANSLNQSQVIPESQAHPFTPVLSRGPDSQRQPLQPHNPFSTSLKPAIQQQTWTGPVLSSAEVRTLGSPRFSIWTSEPPHKFNTVEETEAITCNTSGPLTSDPEKSVLSPRHGDSSWIMGAGDQEILLPFASAHTEDHVISTLDELDQEKNLSERNALVATWLWELIDPEQAERDMLESADGKGYLARESSVNIDTESDVHNNDTGTFLSSEEEAESPTAAANIDLEMQDGYFPASFSETRQAGPLPWFDPPTRPHSSGEPFHPSTSNAAMMKFCHLSRDLETASRAATSGTTSSRQSELDGESISIVRRFSNKRTANRLFIEQGPIDSTILKGVLPKGPNDNPRKRQRSFSRNENLNERRHAIRSLSRSPVPASHAFEEADIYEFATNDRDPFWKLEDQKDVKNAKFLLHQDFAEDLEDGERKSPGLIELDSDSLAISPDEAWSMSDKTRVTKAHYEPSQSNSEAISTFPLDSASIAEKQSQQIPRIQPQVLLNEVFELDDHHNLAMFRGLEDVTAPRHLDVQFHLDQPTVDEDTELVVKVLNSPRHDQKIANRGNFVGMVTMDDKIRDIANYWQRLPVLKKTTVKRLCQRWLERVREHNQEHQDNLFLNDKQRLLQKPRSGLTDDSTSDESSVEDSIATSSEVFSPTPELYESAAEDARHWKRQEVVNSLMHHFFQNFYFGPHFNDFAGSNNASRIDSTSSTSQSTQGTSSTQSGNDSQNSNSIGNANPYRGFGSDPNGFSVANGDMNDAESTKDKSRKFACPYFKRQPATYSSAPWRSCCGPGWDSVHRVKEHLYRRHARPIQCPRCWTVMKSEVAFEEHLQATIPCSKSEKAVAEGFDHDQEKRLKSRKRACPDQTEEQRWREVYKILFPGDPHIPSPYYDYDLKIAHGVTFSTPDAFARYEEFLSQELPRRVRRHLEVLVDRALEPLEEELRNQLVNIVRVSQRELFQSYQAQQLTQRSSAPLPQPADQEAGDPQPESQQNTGNQLEVALDEDWLHLDASLPSFDFDTFGTDPDYSRV